jgi:hypothetical protein
MGVTFDVTVMEELARLAVSSSHPLRCLSVNWADILLDVVLGTSGDAKRNQYDQRKENFLGHLA